MAKKSVDIQKGKIDPNPMTSKQMSRSQQVSEAIERQKMMKDYQTLDMKTPKR